MKILLINNFYYNRGGDCTYLFSLKDLLESKGHEVSVFSMQHPLNFDNKYSKYFVDYINYDDEVKDINIASGTRVLKRTIFSLEAKEKIEQLLKDERPDVAHMQNIHHHITPSILFAFKKYKIPVVWTLHDYSIICPNTSFLSHGLICEKCKKRKYIWPSIEKCKKESFSASTMAGLESMSHYIAGVSQLVNMFIAPSEFLRKKCIEYGIKEKNIRCLHYFIDKNCPPGTRKNSNYYLYAGRLSREKGVKTLIDAAVKVSLNGKDLDLLKKIKLKIVGSGPLQQEMISYAASKDKNNIIEFLGHKRHEEVIELIRGCRFTVVPSEWYENYPFAIMESFICGKPVIGTKFGGIPELIVNTVRGLIFEHGNSDDLCSTIKYLLKNPDFAQEMGDNARTFAIQELNGEKHYEKLMEIYEFVLHKNRNYST
jgi:glycosyltransferase involved in cell wall biosynthesis